MDKDEDLMIYNLKPVELKGSKIGDLLELSFNIGGVFCPISTLLGLGIGAYNKKLAQENIEIFASRINDLIKNKNYLLSKIKKLEKENRKLSSSIMVYKEQAEKITENMLDQESVLIDIRNKTNEELRNFSFNLQATINTTIKEKSKKKINEYAELIIDTIVDDLIFSPSNKYDYVLNVINSLSKNDKDVLDFMSKQKEHVYDSQFSNKLNGKYSVEYDDFLSLQKLIKLGLVDFDTEFYYPHKDYLIEGASLDMDKYYYLTTFFYSIKRYLKLEDETA